MLKKLVKYGNSSALLLDRTLLALLNIKENSILKLRVEGDALIVKVQEEVKPTESLLLEVENIQEKCNLGEGGASSIMNMNEAQIRKYCKEAEDNPQAMKAIQDWLPGTKNAEKLGEAYKVIMAKYSAEIQSLASKEFLKEVEDLSKKHGGDTTSSTYFHEFLELRLKHAPKLAQMDKEMKEVTKALGCPDDLPTLHKAHESEKKKS